MRASRLGLVPWSVALGVLVAACSSSSNSTSGVSGAGVATALQGVYVTASLGPVLQLDFIDTTHVDVTWAACDKDEDECTTSETYSLSDDETEMDLVDSAGKTNVLSLSSVVQESAYSRIDLQGGSLAGGGVSLSGDASTLTRDGGALAHTGVPLVHSFGVTLTSGCAQLFKSANTFPNDRTAFDFFRSKGLSAVQAAAIVGNFDQESGDNPNSVQPGGLGRGIAQWSAGARWDTLSEDNAATYAHQQGESQLSLQLQLQFTWYELSTFSMYGLASLEQQTSLNSAVSGFSKDFEACGTCNQTRRDQYAQAAYNTFAADPIPGADAGMCGGSSGYGSCTAGGASGTCLSSSMCQSKGGTSSAGHCAGPSNIQCCTGATH